MVALLAVGSMVLTGAPVLAAVRRRRVRRRLDGGRPAPPPRATGTLPWRGAWANRRGEAAVRREVPTLVELLRVGISAGLTPVEALSVVAHSGLRASARRFEAVRSSIELGLPLREALTPLGAGTLAPLVGLLTSADDLGTPIDEALARLGGEARADLRRQAEARARTVPVRLLFPLVLLVLPAFGLLAIVPSLLAGFGG